MTMEPSLAYTEPWEADIAYVSCAERLAIRGTGPQRLSSHGTAANRP